MFKKGQSGNPGGRGTEKMFTDMVRIVMAEECPIQKKRKLRVVIEKMAECAMAGESWAVQQVADRLDGKPAQESTVTIDDKRDATDWTRDELVAFLNDCRARGNGISQANGRDHEPDSVH